MKKFQKNLIFSFTALISLIPFFHGRQVTPIEGFIPVTGISSTTALVSSGNQQILNLSGSSSMSNGHPANTFIQAGYAAELKRLTENLDNGSEEDVAAVFSPGKLALHVVSQPRGNNSFISDFSGVATEFGLARTQGNIGLVAHNYLSGQEFFNLSEGDDIHVFYGDKTIKTYQVIELHEYQAIDPQSPYSNFINLNNQQQVSASDLFHQMYAGSHRLTLQTCIQVGTEDSWGRLFVIAMPVG
jgi:hypothetical protein